MENNSAVWRFLNCKMQWHTRNVLEWRKEFLKMFRIVLLLFASSWVLAQNPISLNSVTISEPSAFDFHIDKVVNATEKNVFGSIKGWGKKRIPIIFEKSIEYEFQELFNRSFSSQSQNLLIIRINHFSFHELNYGTLMVPVAEINLSFITKENEVYKEYPSIGIAVNATGRPVEQTIASLLMHCVDLFDFRLKNNLGIPSIVSEQDLTKSSLQSKTFAIHSINQYDKAIFLNFIDFRDYTPCTECDFSVEYKEGSVEKAIPRWDESNSKFKRIWGFTDGKRIFAEFEGKYYPLLKVGNDYMIEGVLPFLYDGNSLREEIQLKLNFVTGNLDPINTTEVKNNYGELVFYFSEYNSGDSKISILIDGRDECILSKGNFYSFQLSPDENEVEVCLKNMNGTICQAISNSLFNRKIFLCDLKKGVPVFEKMSSQLEENINEQIISGEISEDCLSDD